jgi:hypothetical protein
MSFPSTKDVLAEFGLEPVDEDRDLGYSHYRTKAPNGGFEVDFSFGVIERFFQIVLLNEGKEIAYVSSECVREVRIFSDKSGSGLRIDFDYQDLQAQAELRLYPDLKLDWRILRTA